MKYAKPEDYCPKCKGEGSVLVVRYSRFLGYQKDIETCPLCHGRGIKLGPNGDEIVEYNEDDPREER